MEISQLLTFASDNEIENIDLKFCNLFGGSHHITLPIERLDEKLFSQGIGIDGSSVPGFKSTGASDQVIIPDPTTVVIDPFWERNTLSMLCSVHQAASLKQFPLDPRNVVKRAEAFLRKTSIADRSVWGPEFEFYIFDSIDFFDEVNHSAYRIGSEEAGWSECSTCGNNMSYTIPHKAGYHTSPPKDSYFNLRDRMSMLIQEFGIPVKYHHHEVGGPGQAEIEIESSGSLAAADAAIIIKYVCKMLAQEEGCTVTFMPKPLYNEAGSGMHFHQQLFKGKKPVFSDTKGYAGLSKTALYYIGGLLLHGPALLALTNPSTNSYKRLVPGFEAPVKITYGLGNRSAAVRIPEYAKEPERKRIEFRPPDATCNAYLAIAAQLMAGLDGILNKIDPVERGFGPVDNDLSELSSDRFDAIADLPSSLLDAATALKKDHDFLLTGDVFSEDLISTWIAKLKADFLDVRRRPHPYEMRLYYDV